MDSVAQHILEKLQAFARVYPQPDDQLHRIFSILDIERHHPRYMAQFIKIPTRYDVTHRLSPDLFHERGFAPVSREWLDTIYYSMITTEHNIETFVRVTGLYDEALIRSLQCCRCFHSRHSTIDSNEFRFPTSDHERKYRCETCNLKLCSNCFTDELRSAHGPWTFFDRIRYQPQQICQMNGNAWNGNLCGNPAVYSIWLDTRVVSTCMSCFQHFQNTHDTYGRGNLMSTSTVHFTENDLSRSGGLFDWVPIYSRLIRKPRKYSITDTIVTEIIAFGANPESKTYGSYALLRHDTRGSSTLRRKRYDLDFVVTADSAIEIYELTDPSRSVGDSPTPSSCPRTCCTDMLRCTPSGSSGSSGSPGSVTIKSEEPKVLLVNRIMERLAPGILEKLRTFTTVFPQPIDQLRHLKLFREYGYLHPRYLALHLRMPTRYDFSRLVPDADNSVTHIFYKQGFRLVSEEWLNTMYYMMLSPNHNPPHFRAIVIQDFLDKTSAYFFSCPKCSWYGTNFDYHASRREEVRNAYRCEACKVSVCSRCCTDEFRAAHGPMTFLHNVRYLPQRRCRMGIDVHNFFGPGSCDVPTQYSICLDPSTSLSVCEASFSHFERIYGPFHAGHLMAADAVHFTENDISRFGSLFDWVPIYIRPWGKDFVHIIAFGANPESKTYGSYALLRRDAGYDQEYDLHFLAIAGSAEEICDHANLNPSISALASQASLSSSYPSYAPYPPCPPCLRLASS